MDHLEKLTICVQEEIVAEHQTEDGTVIQQNDTGMIIHGAICFGNGDRRFGYIDGDTFIHCSAFINGSNQFEKSTKVEYETESIPEKYKMNANQTLSYYATTRMKMVLMRPAKQIA